MTGRHRSDPVLLDQTLIATPAGMFTPGWRVQAIHSIIDAGQGIHRSNIAFGHALAERETTVTIEILPAARPDDLAMPHLRAARGEREAQIPESGAGNDDLVGICSGRRPSVIAGRARLVPVGRERWKRVARQVG